MTPFDPVSLLDDDPAILRYPTALLESLRDGWSSSVDVLDETTIELVPAHPAELSGHLSRIDDLGQGLVDARLFDGTHPLYAGRPQSAAGRLRFIGDVVLGLVARGRSRRVGSELSALRETIDALAEVFELAPPSVGRLRGARAIEYLAVSWPFQVRSAAYYDGCVPPYDNVPSAPPPLPPPPLPTWTTPPPPMVHEPAGPPPLPPSARGAWTLPHPVEPPPLPEYSSEDDDAWPVPPAANADDEPMAEEPVADEPVADEPVADEPVAEEPGADEAPSAEERDAAADADAARERDDGREPRDDASAADDDETAVPSAPRAPSEPPPSVGIGSLVTAVRELDPIEDDPLPDLASRVTIPLFERELVRLGGELSLVAYEAGRLFGVRDRTPRILARELRRMEHPALTDALLGDGARGMHVDRALMRMVAEAQNVLDEWREHAEGEGDLLDVEVRALRKALDACALVLCQATLAAGVAVGLSEDDWSDYWAGLAEDADDERMAHEGSSAQES